MKKKVAVAMSGGVDSSVSAGLLKEEGYEVIGITMKILPCPDENGSRKTRRNLCCSLADIEDARRVCHRLGIPHYVLDFRKEFEKEIIEYFVSEYLKGNTPNPCIVCNTKIKFGYLLKKLKAMGVDYLATGHYARIEPSNSQLSTINYQLVLKKGIDERKDQSYVLYGLTQEKMKNVLFPLGGHTKSEVRKLAKRWSLPVAEKEESQEICFVQDADYHGFLRARIATDKCKPGVIVNLEGKVLGTHKGLAFYTVGQRGGLNIAYGKPCTRAVQGKPLYVLRIDTENNSLVVGEEKDTYSEKLVARNLNWLTEKPKVPLKVKAKIRYKHTEADALVHPLANGHCRVEFSMPQRAITPGQSVVFYDDDIVLGGGIIAV